MNMRNRHPNRQQSGGFTLIEVLVAVLIFSFGVLGFVGLQARAIQYSVGAEDTNRAALLANELATTLLLQRGAAAAASSTDFIPWGNLNDTAASGAIVDWQARVAAPRNAASGVDGGLPNGVGTVTVISDATKSVARISLTWKAVTAPASAASSTYSTEVVLP